LIDKKKIIISFAFFFLLRRINIKQSWYQSFASLRSNSKQSIRTSQRNFLRIHFIRWPILHSYNSTYAQDSSKYFQSFIDAHSLWIHRRRISLSVLSNSMQCTEFFVANVRCKFIHTISLERSSTWSNRSLSKSANLSQRWTNRSSIRRFIFSTIMYKSFMW